MKTNRFMNSTGKSLLMLGLGLLLSSGAALAADAGVKTLRGHVPPGLARLQAKGRLAANTNLTLAIGLPLRNTESLTNLLKDIYDPASPNYHHFLTPDEFTAQFGPTAQDYQKVVDFANSNGLSVTKTHGNRVLLDVTGKVSDIEKAFHVTMHTYRHPSESRDFFAPDTEPSVGTNVPVLHVSGLENYALPRPALHKMPASSGNPLLGSSPGGGYIGSDFRNAYVPGTSLNGSGQMVGLLQFDSGFYQSDITAYEIQAGLPTTIVVQPVLLDGYGGGPGVANDEVSLDIEMVISMAPAISKVLVFEGDLTDDILNAMAASNQVKQLSASWSYPLDQISEQIYQQFAAQGQSFFNASGDSDAWLTGGIPQPCDDPHITIVGGTTLSTTLPNGPWTSETVWNWGIEYGDDGVGGGGGISTTYDIPSWQTNIDMTSNKGSTTFRNIPDVAMTADNVYVTYGGGLNGSFGGTSCATPLWAGFTALVNQQAAANGNQSVGFLNPALYAIAKTAGYANYFHDITTGNNTWSQSPNLFFAVPGYDLATGLGTPAGISLINALAGTNFITPLSAPSPPYGSTLSALNGGNPNGTWSLFVQDDQSPDSGAISNGWSITLTLASPVGSSADNALTMSVSATNVLVNSNAVFIVGITNYGPSTSSNVLVSDTLPSGITLVSSNITTGTVNRNGTLVTWNVGALTNGAGAQLLLAVRSSSVGTILNSAVVRANTPDANSDDDSASAAANIVSSLSPPVVAGASVSGSGGAFHLTISGPTTSSVIIQATTNLVNPNWVNVFNESLWTDRRRGHGQIHRRPVSPRTRRANRGHRRTCPAACPARPARARGHPVRFRQAGHQFQLDGGIEPRRTRPDRFCGRGRPQKTRGHPAPAHPRTMARPNRN
jgi:uncharacterized repeat protein (TIGR01451 family)